MKRDFSHLPARVERSAAGSWRASAIIIAIVCSAVVTELPNGVFITTTPRCGRGRKVDVVDPDAGAADHLEARRRGQQRGRDLGRRADREAVVTADDPRSARPRPARSGPRPRRRAARRSRPRPGSARRRSEPSASQRPSAAALLGRTRSRARAAAPRGRRPRRSPRPTGAGRAARRGSPRCRRRRPPLQARRPGRLMKLRLARGRQRLRRRGRRSSGRSRSRTGSRAAARGNRPRACAPTQPSITSRLAALRAISASRPPIRSAQASPSSASSTASIDGVLIVSPRKTPSISLPLAVRRSSFGSGQGGR